MPGDSLPHLEVLSDSLLLLVGGRADTSGILGRIASGGVLPDGRILVSSDSDKRLHLFDRQGQLLKAFGQRGEGPGEFKREPMLFVFHDSLVAVQTIFNTATVTVFDGNLQVAREYSVDFPLKQTSTPWPVGMSDSGQIVFQREHIRSGIQGAYRAEATLWRVSRDGGTAKLIVSLLGDERVGLPNNLVAEVVFGKRTVATVSRGRVIAGTNDNFRLQVWDANGALGAIINVRGAGQPVTRAMRDRYIEDARAATVPETRQLTESFLTSATFAEYLPWYDRVSPTREGGLWVRFATSESEPATRDYLVLDSTWAATARVRLPSHMSPLTVWADTILVRGRDDDDASFLALYQLRPRR
jgi:hypothetical protein